MPYKDDYDSGNFIFSKKEGFIRKEPQVRGEISIRTLEEETVKKHGIEVGDILPWSGYIVTK